MELHNSSDPGTIKPGSSSTIRVERHGYVFTWHIRISSAAASQCLRPYGLTLAPSQNTDEGRTGGRERERERERERWRERESILLMTEKKRLLISVKKPT